ncbi:hypothetical protein GIB67_042408 [Kingdonia uniflora]|uniref:Uncharacterized protein n=1 Tax=Kingdonia uniflora TaxID=39325 RepID=A0A7J7M873_9MAGN|nr:hypothetical protein GIB67_042408 [Kingdonia uniflora]
MKSDKEVNEQVSEENQIQEGRAKKGTSNAKNYTSRCTGLGLHKMFAALPEEEKGALCATCFAPSLLIDPITMMSTLVVEIFDRHHEDVLRLNLLKIILSFLLPNKGRNVEVRYVDLVDDLDQFNKFPWAMMASETDMQQDLVQETMRYQIEAPAMGVAPTIGVPTICAPAVVAPTIGNSSSATKIRAVVVRVCSQLEEHGKMLLKLDDNGKILHTHVQTRTKKGRRWEKEEGGAENKKGKGEWQKKVEEADVPNKKKKVEGTKKEALIEEQFDHVPLIQLKALIPKIPKKGLANRVPRKRRVQFPELQNIQSTAENLLQQVAPGEILEVANAFMVDDDVEVGREVDFNAISSEYGGDLLTRSVEHRSNNQGLSV